MSIKLYDKSGGTPQEVLLAGTSTTDLILNGTSKNPIANKTVYNALATKIESTVENLVNFYNKSQVYNKQEVRDLIGAINTLTIEVVNELPTQDISATTIYFLKQSGANTYDEYIYVDNAWVKIGDTDIDLSGYLTTANFQIAIADYYTKSAIDAMIANYYTKTQVDAMVDAKQDELTFDNAPTEGSDNPVKSGGIKTALDAKQNTLTFDSTPTAGSSNPVTSDGIKDAIDDTAADIYEVMGNNGAKNLLRYPYNQTTKTISGITFTDNGDGSITANGTATASVYLIMSLATSKDLFIKSGKYTISGCPSGGSSSTYRISCGYRSGDVYRAYGNDVGNGFTFIATSDDYSDEGVYLQCACNIDNGTTVNNIVFKPMLRLASDTDSTYQPYAMTNQQMTPYVQSVSNPNLLDNPWFTINQRGVTDSWNTQFSVGVDRWAKSSDSSSTLEVTTDGITEVDDKAFSIYQVLDNTATNYESIKRLYGKTLTLSVLFSDGTIETGSYNLPLSDYRPSANQIRTFINDSTRIEYARIESFAVGNVNLAIRVKAGNVVRAVKLEIGTVSTLINDTAPNYQQELAKCQRYFQRIMQAGSLDTLCMATYRNDYTLRAVLPLTVPMRAAPSVTVNGTVSDYTNSGLTMAKISQPVTNGGAAGISFNISKSGVTWNNGVSKCITPDSTDFYIDFSADL